MQVNSWAIPAGPASEIPDDFEGSVYPWHPDGVPRDHDFMPWYDTDTCRLICARCHAVSDGNFN